MYSKVVCVVDFEIIGIELFVEVCEVGICDVDILFKMIDDWSLWLCGV